ncbi:hypothetical protein [Streptomyces monashensis]|uniref:hypothetical protein n=1 Tax=Streptomyces monashensis TaxID=1678012 RepID=UPI0015A5E1CD
MSERLADDLDVHACRQHECGGGIAQIVESAGVLPAFSPLLAVAFLAEPVGLEDLEGLVVQGDETDARIGLGSAFVDLSSVLDDLGGDGQGLRGGRQVECHR